MTQTFLLSIMARRGDLACRLRGALSRRPSRTLAHAAESGTVSASRADGYLVFRWSGCRFYEKALMKFQVKQDVVRAAPDGSDATRPANGQARRRYTGFGH